VKEFFDGFARDKGFDPRNPDHWYAVELKEITEKKVNKPPASCT